MYEKMERIEKDEKEKYIRKEAKEVVQRNKGNIRRYVITLDHLILFFGILGYQDLIIDFQYLKIELQMEKEKYQENNSNSNKSINSQIEKKDCNKCDFYGECDHQGAYQTNGKWCYEIFENEKGELEKDLNAIGIYLINTSEPLYPKIKQIYLNKSCSCCGKMLCVADFISCSKCTRKNKKKVIEEFIDDIDNILYAQIEDWKEILEVLKEEYKNGLKK